MELKAVSVDKRAVLSFKSVQKLPKLPKKTVISSLLKSSYCAVKILKISGAPNVIPLSMSIYEPWQGNQPEDATVEGERSLGLESSLGDGLDDLALLSIVAPAIQKGLVGALPCGCAFVEVLQFFGDWGQF